MASRVEVPRNSFHFEFSLTRLEPVGVGFWRWRTGGDKDHGTAGMSGKELGRGASGMWLLIASSSRHQNGHLPIGRQQLLFSRRNHFTIALPVKQRGFLRRHLFISDHLFINPPKGERSGGGGSGLD